MADWKFLQKHLGPEVGLAWDRDVGLPDSDFVIGYSGTKHPKPRTREKPLRGYAHTSKSVHGRPALFEYDPETKRWSPSKPASRGADE